MLILLIILISILIFALRLTLIGTEIAGKVVIMELKRSKRVNKKKRRKGKITRRRFKRKESAIRAKQAVARVTKRVVTEVLRLFVTALRWIRTTLISALSAVLVVDIILLFVIVGGAGYAYLEYYQDEAGDSYSTENKQENSSGSVDINKLDWNSITDSSAREVLQTLSKTWGSEVTEERAKMIMLGATRIGISHYSQEQSDGRGGDSDDQRVFDCSSFVGWTYNKSGHSDIPTYTTTSSYLVASEDYGYVGQYFDRVTADQLIPGDVALMNDSLDGGNANHAGIYVGKNADGELMFMHCTSRTQEEPHYVTDGVRIGRYPSFTIFFRYKNWK